MHRIHCKRACQLTVIFAFLVLEVFGFPGCRGQPVREKKSFKALSNGMPMRVTHIFLNRDGKVYIEGKGPMPIERIITSNLCEIIQQKMEKDRPKESFQSKYQELIFRLAYYPAYPVLIMVEEGTSAKLLIKTIRAVFWHGVKNLWLCMEDDRLPVPFLSILSGVYPGEHEGYRDLALAKNYTPPWRFPVIGVQEEAWRWASIAGTLRSLPFRERVEIIHIYLKSGKKILIAPLWWTECSNAALLEILTPCEYLYHEHEDYHYHGDGYPSAVVARLHNVYKPALTKKLRGEEKSMEKVDERFDRILRYSFDQCVVVLHVSDETISAREFINFIAYLNSSLIIYYAVALPKWEKFEDYEKYKKHYWELHLFEKREYEREEKAREGKQKRKKGK